MSDDHHDEVSKTNTSKIIILNGTENYHTWKSSLLSAVLSEQAGLALSELYQPDLFTLPPSSDQSEDAKAERRAHRNRAKVYGWIWSSLSESLRDDVPSKHHPEENLVDPDPRALYTWLVSEYSASDNARLALLFQTITTTHMDPSPDADPLPALRKISNAINDLKSATKGMSANAVLEAIKAFAMLGVLNPSWGLWVSTVYKEEKLTGEKVRNLVEAEIARKKMDKEREDMGQAYYSRGKTDSESGSGSNNWVKKKTADKHCSLHGKCYHTTEQCRGDGKGQKAKETSGQANIATLVEYDEEEEIVSFYCHNA